MTTINSISRRFAMPLLALALMTVSPFRAVAQDGHAHAEATQQPDTKEVRVPQAEEGTLLKIVQDATARYQDVSVAEKDGYALQFGCVTGEDDGAMGLHYINGDLVNAAVLDPKRPQIVIYEPMPDGSKRLIGADFLVIADAWNAGHSSPPQMMGQLFHLFPSPNRFGLPAFYTLHVWAWKENPKGTYTNWHSKVSCKSFVAK